jgi:hypothetical protein
MSNIMPRSKVSGCAGACGFAGFGCTTGGGETAKSRDGGGIGGIGDGGLAASAEWLTDNKTNIIGKKRILNLLKHYVVHADITRNLKQ